MERHGGADSSEFSGAGLHASVEPHEFGVGKSDGRAVDSDCLRVGRNGFHGLLDDGFSSGAARAVGEGRAFGKARANYRVVLQDGGTADCDLTGTAGPGGAAVPSVSRECGTAGAIQIRRRAAADAGALLRAWAAGTR